MTFAHKSSRLSMRNTSPVLPEGMILFPLDGRVIDTLDSIPVSINSTTMRTDEKKFSASVAVEDDTVNLLYDNGVYNGYFGSLTLVPTVTEIVPNNRYRIKTDNTSGGNSIRFFIPLTKLTNGATYNLSYKYRIISGSIFSMSDWCDTPLTTTDIDYGTYKFSSAFGTRSTYDSTFRFMDFNVSPNTEIEIWDIQLEQKDHFTSFTTGTRSWGGLRYDISSLGMRDAGCISCWILNSDTMIYCRKNGTSDPNNQYLLKVGTDINDGYKDNITIRIPGSTTVSSRIFTIFASSTANTQGSYDGTRSSYSLGSNTWNHFVLQWDKNGLPSGNTLELYINGVLEIGGVTTNILPANILTYIQVGNWMDYNSLMPCTLFEQLAIHPSKGFSPDIIESWYKSNAPFFDPRDAFAFI